MSGFMQREEVVAAGGVTENILAGSAFEFVGRPAIVTMGITASADGGFITIQGGSNIVLEESQPRVVDRLPLIPDEMYYSFFAAPGDRLVIRLRNPSGGNITFRALVQVVDVG